MSDPVQSDRGFDPLPPRANSPHPFELGMRSGQRGYMGPGGVSPDTHRSQGPPSIPPSGEIYLRNFHHLPGPVPATFAPPWMPNPNPPLPEDFPRNVAPPPASWGASRGVDSPLPSGYDYLFVPSLEPKYECPICLMCLRDPMQTECGHRFCASCIKQCLRDAGARCPVDNEPLTENQMFPDVCVRREILDLQARCPYKDCPELVELRNIENHKEGCVYRTEPCPNRCGLSMRRKSLGIHLDNDCPKRLVDCLHCQQEFPYDYREAHEDECPKRPVQCKFCHQTVISEELRDHHKRTCTAVPVPCQFAAFRCTERLPKDEMQTHIKEGMGYHLELMASHLRKGSPTLQNSDRANNPEYQDLAWRAGALYDGRGDYPSMSNNERSEYATAAANKLGEVPEYGMKKPNAEMLGTCRTIGKGAMAPATSPGYASMGAPSFGDPWELVRQLRDKVKELQEKAVLTKQTIIELEGKTQNKDAEIKCLRDKVHELQFETKDLREHVANGVFVWRLRNYSDLKRAAERGEGTVKHSDGFYTSSCGYRLCIRVNINKSESRGVTFVSLFVHFMQGKYDDFLEWPFRGSIKISIIDQHDDPDVDRKNISEILLAKSSLDAFKRPKTVRNHKGFGYMEFASVESLELDGHFIKDETILIKVEVKPQ